MTYYLLTILATAVAYWCVLRALSGAPAGSRRRRIGQLMSAQRRTGGSGEEGAVPLRRTGGSGEEA